MSLAAVSKSGFAADQVYDCPQCLDIGVRISPKGHFQPCPAIELGQPHCEPTPAAAMIQRAIFRKGVKPDSHLFDVARTLAAFSTAYPCSRFELIERHFAYVHGEEKQRRKVSAAIETLRDEWLLPVGSRKGHPSGYWIITDEKDFIAWVDFKKAQPIKELSSIARLARTYWPIFAEQLELEFSDLGVSDVG